MGGRSTEHMWARKVRPGHPLSRPRWRVADAKLEGKMGTHASFGVNHRGCGVESVNSFRFVSKPAVQLNIRKALQMSGGTLVALLLSLPAYSQGSAGRILGAITDSNGGAIAGATVTVADVQRGSTRTLTTDESGAYNAPNLIPGGYKVRAEFKGFKVTERQNV